MTSLLAIAALGSWSYAGFLDEPGAGPAPTPPIPAPAPEVPEKPRPPAPTPAPARPDVPEPPAVDRPAAPEVPNAQAARVEAPAASTPAPRYRLADASGQVWEHADAAQLRGFVEARNRSFVAVPAYHSAGATRYSSCSNGRCR